MVAKRSVDVRPPMASFTPSLWTHHNFSSFSSDDQVQEKYALETETLKAEARSMLMAKGSTNAAKLILIDTIERLGVAYHFEQEIEQQLQQIYNFYESSSKDIYDLFTTALKFRLLRQHHYQVSSNVFRKFKDDNNKFKETLRNDTKGLLSLFEATQVRIHGEDILDEASDFTTNQLNQMLSELESPLHDQVKRALQHSLHRGFPRLETRAYISIYETYDAKNQVLLKFAKLDFNFLQSLYKKELYDLMRWWSDLDIKSKLPYARDRLVECYVWGMACCFQPQYSNVRKAIAKSIQMATTVDDTYDNYATLEEARLFTEILQSWDINETECLPDYMKVVYKLILSVYEDYEREAAKQDKLFAVPYAKETVKQLGRAYYKEMKWFMGQHHDMPTFDVYLSNTLITGCIYVILTGIVLGMKSVSKETVDWEESKPNKMLAAAAKIARYWDDLSSHERENKKGRMLTSVDCYMKQYNMSEKETMDKFRDSIEAGWKDLNEEWVVDTSMPKEFREALINYARTAEVTYKNCEDGITNPEKSLAPKIRALFVDPIII